MTRLTTATPLETAPERIERSILGGILDGRHPPGVRLPTLRELAETYSVNPSTMQRALARLEARGVVTAHQGSGVLVNDPLVAGDAGLLPVWFVLAVDSHPEASVGMVRDVLDVRRLFAVRLLSGLGPAAAEVITEQVIPAVSVPGVTTDDVVEVDMALTAMVVASSGSTLMRLLSNTIREILGQVALLREAAYGDLDRYVGNLRRLADALSPPRTSQARRAVALESILVEADAVTVERFAGLVREGAADGLAAAASGGGGGWIVDIRPANLAPLGGAGLTAG